MVLGSECLVGQVELCSTDLLQGGAEARTVDGAHVSSKGARKRRPQCALPILDCQYHDWGVQPRVWDLLLGALPVVEAPEASSVR
jgi:hypothetical protein